MEWISVKDRLPTPEEDRILAYCFPYNDMYKAFENATINDFMNINVLVFEDLADTWCVDETGSGHCGMSLDFTHWMLLPKPPEEE